MFSIKFLFVVYLMYLSGLGWYALILYIAAHYIDEWRNDNSWTMSYGKK